MDERPVESSTVRRRKKPRRSVEFVLTALAPLIIIAALQVLLPTTIGHWLIAIVALLAGYAFATVRHRLTTERTMFAALIENSPDLVGIAEADGTPFYLNPAGRRMVGLAPDFPVETTRLPEYYPAELRAFASDVIVTAIQGAGQWSDETRFRNWQTEATIPVSATHFLIRDPRGGRVLGIGTIARDISALNRAREARERASRRLRHTARSLAETQQLLEAVFEHSPSAIVVKDVDGRFVLTNRRFQLIMGVGDDDVRGKTDYGVLGREIADRHKAVDEAAITTGRPVTVEETGELADGQTHTFLETVFPLRDDRGNAYGVCWIGTEITERKRSEEILERAAADLQEAQRVAHIGSWSWDMATERLTWSEELYRIHGRDPSLPPPDYRRDFAKLFPPESASVLLAAIDRLRKDGTPYQLEIETLLPDGSRKWIGVRGEGVYDADHRLVGMRGTTQDITTIKHLERMKEEWTSVIAHDLRRPIGVIKMSAQLLPEVHRGALDEKEKQIAERIQSAANGLTRMVDDLLDLSRLETRRLTLEQVALDPRSIVRQTLGRLSHLTVGCNVDVTESGTPNQVYVDPVRFEQVLGNLISNAVKHGEKNGDIRVHVAAEDCAVRISVTNRGRGITADELPRLFARFARSRTSSVQGLGLGLYIAKGLVEAHGGRMWVDSVPGDTTTFHFTLPTEPCDDRRVA